MWIAHCHAARPAGPGGFGYLGQERRCAPVASDGRGHDSGRRFAAGSCPGRPIPIVPRCSRSQAINVNHFIIRENAVGVRRPVQAHRPRAADQLFLRPPSISVPAPVGYEPSPPGVPLRFRDKPGAPPITQNQITHTPTATYVSSWPSSCFTMVASVCLV